MAKFDYLHTNKHELLGLNGVWVVETANECPGAVAEYVVAFEAVHIARSQYTGSFPSNTAGHSLELLKGAGLRLKHSAWQDPTFREDRVIDAALLNTRFGSKIEDLTNITSARDIKDIAAEAELKQGQKNCLSDQAIVYAGLREVYTRLGLLTQNGEISQKAIAAASYLRADVRNPIDRGVWDTRVHAFVMQMGDPREFIPKVTGTDKSVFEIASSITQKPGVAEVYGIQLKEGTTATEFWMQQSESMTAAIKRSAENAIGTI